MECSSMRLKLGIARDSSGSLAIARNHIGQCGAVPAVLPSAPQPFYRRGPVPEFALRLMGKAARIICCCRRRTSNLLYFVVLITLWEYKMILAARTMASNEMTNNVQTPVIIAHNLPNMENLDLDSGARLCEIEYQVTRKTIGKCVKLGRGLTGCVSEKYVNPFHQDCF
ncbi:uncharacterized protein LOC143212003 isoform X2 [Lasioglossum baleicum]|uniref:uncharacterized protein LOC143212003 isoform X2 n=1 Tax=Lasioglossum baleicum TaxID=434251 RepID=UPI003FCCF774